MRALTVDHALAVYMACTHSRKSVRINAIAPDHITTPPLFSVAGVTPEADCRQRLAAASTMPDGDGWDVG